MSNKELLENIKKLRELTGVGFKDCKLAIDENKGDLEKSINIFLNEIHRTRINIKILIIVCNSLNCH